MPLPSQPDSDAVDTDAEAEREPGTPRWVRLTALAILVLAVLVVVVLLIGGDGHGPGRHADGGPISSTASESGGTTSGHTPPSGGHE